MLASRVEATLAGAGHEVTVASDSAAADLGRGGPDRRRRGRGRPRASWPATAPGARLLLATPTPRRRARAEAAGVDLVVPRSRLARELPELVDGLLALGDAGSRDALG